jgi:hypothetical protein
VYFSQNIKCWWPWKKTRRGSMVVLVRAIVESSAAYSGLAQLNHICI